MNESSQVQSLHTFDQGEIKRLPIMVTLVIGAFFAILNETLLNVALIELMNQLQITASKVQWLATGFMLVVGILVPITALIVQWFTTRQMFLGAMGLFTIGTILCGMATNFPILLIGRLIQASGTGLLMPVMMNTILILYPPEKRGAAMGMMGLVITFAPALGPTLSGLIIDLFHWRWLFLLVVPFSVLTMVVAFFFLKNVTPVTKPKVDIISVVLSTLGFGGIVYGFSIAGEWGAGDTSFLVFTPLIVGGISLFLFIWRQLKLEEPILDVRTFRSPMFTLTTILLVIMMMTMFSTIILIPMFLQGALLLSAYMAGLALLPGGLINGLISPITGKLFDLFGPRRLIIPGAILLVIIMWLFTRIHLNSSILFFIVLHCLLMIAIAMIMMPTQTNGLNDLTPKQYPHGTAILNTLSQVSGAIGVAFYIGIMSAGEAEYLQRSSNPDSITEKAAALMTGVQNAFTVGLGFAVIALILTFFVKRTASPTKQ